MKRGVDIQVYEAIFADRWIKTKIAGDEDKKLDLLVRLLEDIETDDRFSELSTQQSKLDYIHFYANILLIDDLDNMYLYLLCHISNYSEVLDFIEDYYNDYVLYNVGKK